MGDFTPKLFTIFKNGYCKNDLHSDAMAGLTVAIIALPLAMALAIASGASPDKGLITAVVAGFIVSFLGGSRIQVGGPTGAFVVVIYNVISLYGYDGLILATFLAGFILVVAGYAKFGQIIRFIPRPVVTGFTSGIAVIIASSQIKDFFGLRIENVPADFVHRWQAYFEAIGTLNPATVVIGFLSLLIIISLRRFAPKWPGYLIAVLVASIIVAIFHIPIDTIGSCFPEVSFGLAMPQMPVWDLAKLRSVVPAAFTIAFLAGIEALLSAVVSDGMTGYKHRPNQELVGQGVANVVSAIFGGLPATGAIARTATNIKAGAKTPMSGIFHALFLLVFMLFASKVMVFVPMTTLAAILFMVAWGMSEFGSCIHIYRLSQSGRVILLLTFLLTILVDLTAAIGVGVTLACLIFMKHMAGAVEIKSKWHDANIEYDDKDESQRKELPENVEVFQISGPFFFGVANNLVDTLKAMGQMPKILIIRMRLVPYLDTTGESVLESIIKQCAIARTQVILSGVRGQPMRILKRARLFDGKFPVIFCDDYSAALKRVDEMLAQKEADPF